VGRGERHKFITVFGGVYQNGKRTNGRGEEGTEKGQHGKGPGSFDRYRTRADYCRVPEKESRQKGEKRRKKRGIEKKFSDKNKEKSSN